jgi:hypothetical protein
MEGIGGYDCGKDYFYDPPTQTACEAYHIFPGLSASSSEDIVNWIEELVFNSPIFSSGSTIDEGGVVGAGDDMQASSYELCPKLPMKKRQTKRQTKKSRHTMPGTTNNLIECMT